MATASIKRGLCNPCQLCCRKIDDTRNRWNLGITSAECATVQLLWTDYVVYADSNRSAHYSSHEGFGPRETSIYRAGGLASFPCFHHLQRLAHGAGWETWLRAWVDTCLWGQSPRRPHHR